MLPRLITCAFALHLFLPSLHAAQAIEDLAAGQPESGRIVTGKSVARPGRHDGRKAMLLNGATAAWPLPAPDAVAAPRLIEFWVQPESWQGIDAEEVVIATLSSGETPLLTLKKAKDTPQLILTTGDTSIASYPIYRWGDAFWKRPSAKPGEWHQIVIELGNAHIGWAVDGFSVGTFTLPSAGSASELILGDLQHTSVFSDLVLRSGPLASGEELRKQFRISYNRQPELPAPLVTAPYSSEIPSEPEAIRTWLLAHGTELPPFTSTVQQTLLSEPIRGFIAYDDKALYLHVSVPFEGELDSKDWQEHDAPLYSEESLEFFLHPPLTGVPDYVQLIGNPHGNRSDIRVFDKSWNGSWQWIARVDKGAWEGLLIAPFDGLSLPNPGAAASWTMNIFHTNAKAAWAWTDGAYHNTDAFGALRFLKGAPVIRTAQPSLQGERLSVPITLEAGDNATPLKATLAYFPEGAIFPSQSDEKLVTPTQGKAAHLELNLDGVGSGMTSLTITQGDQVIYAQPFRAALAPKQLRGGKSAQEKKPAEQVSGTPARQWSAEELGKTIQDAALWKNNTLGNPSKPPAPWQPVKVEKESVTFWNRVYGFGKSLFFSSLTSGGDELLAAPIRLVVGSKGKALPLAAGESRVISQDANRAVVEATGETDGLRAKVTREVEFDGVIKVSLELSAGSEQTFDSLALEIPLKGAFATQYHYTASYSGHPPETNSGSIDREGFTLDRLREIVWVGNLEGGITWFTEGLENWPLWDEKAIISVSPERDGQRILRIKLGDRPFRLKEPLRIAFGLQVTPSRPRPLQARKMADKQSYTMPWYRGDGHYIPWHDAPEPSRKQISEMRAKGIEIMPVSSLRYYGKYYFDHNDFQKLPNGGMLRPELYLWGRAWQMTSHRGAVSLPELDNQQEAPGSWRDIKFRPRDLTDCCPRSAFQDFYIWKLDRLIRDTGVGAWYLDQPLVRCSNPLHGCGYVDYKGEWRPSTPVFAMRNMVRRIYQLFYEHHGHTHIRWHSSNHLITPCLSFTDVNWDGENYLYGPLRVGEFYSRKLPLERLRVQHSGLPFGFMPDLLPEFGHLQVARRIAPSPDSVRDMMGLFMVHDSNVAPMWTAHNDLVNHLQKRRLEFPFTEERPIFYWDNDPRILVTTPKQLLFIAHPAEEQLLLVLFNPTDAPVEAVIQLDLPALNLSAQGPTAAEDFEQKAPLPLQGKEFRAMLAPHDFRMIRLYQPTAQPPKNPGTASSFYRYETPPPP